MNIYRILVLLCSSWLSVYAYASPPDTLWVRKVHPQGNGCNSVCFSSNGAQVLAGTNCHNAFAKLFNAISGDEEWLYTDSSLMCFMDVKFSPNGERFAIMEEFGVLLVFDYSITPPQLFAQLDTRSNGSLALAFTNDNQSVITTGFDDSIRVFEIETANQTKVFGPHSDIFSVATNQQQNFIATGNQTGSIKIWSVEGSLIKSLTAFSQPIKSMAFTEDGTKLLAASQTGRVLVFNTSTWQRDTSFVSHAGSVNGIALAANQNWFATAGAGGRICVWDLNTYALIQRFDRPELGTLNAVSIAPDGSKLAVAGSLGHAAVFDITGIVTSIAIDESLDPMKVYPNPVTDFFAVEGPFENQIWITVFNAFGRLMLERSIATHQEVSTVDWPSGIYFMQYRSSKTSGTTKIIK